LFARVSGEFKILLDIGPNYAILIEVARRTANNGKPATDLLSI
jgi:hypothetical protein